MDDEPLESHSLVEAVVERAADLDHLIPDVQEELIEACIKQFGARAITAEEHNTVVQSLLSRYAKEGAIGRLFVLDTLNTEFQGAQHFPIIMCPAEPRHPGDLCGCGAAFTQQPDSEGLYDCPCCGLFFALDAILKTSTGRRDDE